jgi:hypothetical protein
MKSYKFARLLPFVAAPISVSIFGLLMHLAMQDSQSASVFAIGSLILLLPELIVIAGLAWLAYTIFRVIRGRLPSGIRYCTRCGGDLNFVHTKSISFSVCKSCGATYRD